MNSATDELFEREMNNGHFRVTIFGSARIREGDEWFQTVFDLSKDIASHDIDIITGGGPGVMEAANAGHHAGRNSEEYHSLGMTVRLPFEENVNDHLDVRKHFERFSNRLDHFMALSHAVVVMPGGIGTCLELFYTWQLIQVKHMCQIPIILYGEMWEGLLEWVKSQPIRKGFISPEDADNVCIVRSNAEALEHILEHHKKFLDPENSMCRKKYTVQKK